MHVMSSLVGVVHARNKFECVSDPSPKICKFYPLYSSSVLYGVWDYNYETYLCNNWDLIQNYPS